MTLVKPNRDTFRTAYKTITGVELSDNIVNLFFTMVARIHNSRINTHWATIEWNGETVNLRKRFG